MVTLAQAQERAERWVNGEVPAYEQREVRVREFDLGFVAWAEDRAGAPASDSGDVRLVIARDSGETTLWPALPVGEVIRRYEEEYGEEPAAPAAPPQAAARPRGDLLPADASRMAPAGGRQDGHPRPALRRHPRAHGRYSCAGDAGTRRAAHPPPPAAPAFAGDTSGGAPSGPSPWDGADTGGAGQRRGAGAAGDRVRAAADGR